MDVGQIKSVFRDDVVVDILGKVTFESGWLAGLQVNAEKSSCELRLSLRLVQIPELWYCRW